MPHAPTDRPHLFLFSAPFLFLLLLRPCLPRRTNNWLTTSTRNSSRFNPASPLVQPPRLQKQQQPACGRRFSRLRHLCGRRHPEEGKSRGPLSRQREAVSPPAARSHRRGRSQARRLEHGPVQFIEKDGYFYGRGTGDDKAQAAVWIASLMRYKREGFRPDRDIIVALTADEEGGGPYNGVDWLLKNHRDLIDAELALNEGGWGEAEAARRSRTTCRSARNTSSIAVSRCATRADTVRCPVQDNAIYHLAGALDRLSAFGFPLKTNDVTRGILQADGEDRDRADRNDLAKVAAGIAGRDAAGGEGFAGVERDAAHDVRRHATGGRPRQECACRSSRRRT